MIDEPFKVLTIAGSDSGGAAGLQADLKTWTALGVYGMSVVTAVTAQNSMHVTNVQYMSPALVSAQLQAVLSDYGAQAVKTGFIGQVGIIEAIAQELRNFSPKHLVVDPVLVNHLGQSLFTQEVIQAYRDRLLPLANLITPNWREAALLAELSLEEIHIPGAIDTVAEKLHALGAGDILITGHLAGSHVIDYYSDGEQWSPLSNPRIVTENKHGSGDTLSAAICAYLARGDAMVAAIKKARQYTAKALQSAANWQLGQGHGPLSHFT